MASTIKRPTKVKKKKKIRALFKYEMDILVNKLKLGGSGTVTTEIQLEGC